MGMQLLGSLTQIDLELSSSPAHNSKMPSEEEVESTELLLVSNSLIRSLDSFPPPSSLGHPLNTPLSLPI